MTGLGNESLSVNGGDRNETSVAYRVAAKLSYGLSADSSSQYLVIK